MLEFESNVLLYCNIRVYIYDVVDWPGPSESSILLWLRVSKEKPYDLEQSS
jgi:hypothetical protein